MSARMLFSLGLLLLLRDVVGAERLPEPPLFVVPGDGSLVHFAMHCKDQKPGSSLNRSTKFVHEIGYFFVDAPDGRILRRTSGRHSAPPSLDACSLPQFTRPTDADYAEVALSDGRAATLFAGASGSHANLADLTVSMPGDRFIGFYLIEGHSIGSWRYAPSMEKPRVWFSFPAANPNGRVALKERIGQDSHLGWNCLEWEIDGGIPFSYHMLPIASDDVFTVYCAGDDFRGKPQALEIDTPHDASNKGLGLFFNDRAFNGCSLKVTHIRLEGLGAPWIELRKKSEWALDCAVLDTLETHGHLTVFSNGGIQFIPNVEDPFWNIDNQPAEPLPVMIEYRVHDGVDAVESRFGIGHGYYHRGRPSDHKQEGSRMYFLAGGGMGRPFNEGRIQFFSEAASNRDIVLISQALENKDFANLVFEYFAAHQARSVTCLSITSRSQADDPRMAQVIAGADLIWLGGGSQSFFLESWRDTRTYAAIQKACANGVSIGGTSAGSAILGHAAYTDLPWDSVQSSFALVAARDDRLRTIHQGQDGFPFECLSARPSSPLHRMIVETHFTDSNRMGRLATFTSRCHRRPMSGVGIDASTAILIRPLENDWSWNVFGSGSIFIVDPSEPYCREDRPDDQDFHCDRVHIVRLKPGQQVRLSEVRNALPSYRVFIRSGVIYSLDNGGRLY